MRDLADQMHSSMITGEKAPKLSELSDNLTKIGNLGEVQLCYDILGTLVRLSLGSQGAVATSLGLIDLFEDGQAQKLTFIADLIAGGSNNADQLLISKLDGVPLKGLQSGRRPSQETVVLSELLFNHQRQLDFKTFAWELLTRQHSGDALLFANLFLSEEDRN